MSRVWSVGLVALGVLAVWTVVGRLQARTRRRDDLGTISDAWLHDPRSFPSE